ncbi:hypothetical protein BST27_18605 [Mycobacterium intermedium]|uniref:Uncharacterized protein n=1 Tax=Mycobacterium intermedium TaxID=28445 RepID=A0A1E3SGG8_MYCIE|nr:hypothetical protein [Mycobacterium intermedium]MCV6963071.1 hypothetical protein [Mycobacterium intermedium]ODR00668.1 hypothetical protein BHQ20_11795 [Mycobacterium intermedium]OPE52287.1 hypothetical protein BV508_02775 [Mycobacterium intermedium]ORB00273.1 hypothetical protein BST27_18605 [Mycobacterium intermedium]
MSHTPDNATTWRDLADALTPQQVAYIEEWERHPELPPRVDGSVKTPEEHQRTLLHVAREFLGSNTAAVMLADVAPPDGGDHRPWQDEGDGTWSRFFVGTVRTMGDVRVIIDGTQYSDGRIERFVTTDSAEGMGSAEARQLAALIIEAADEIDGWAER